MEVKVPGWPSFVQPEATREGDPPWTEPVRWTREMDPEGVPFDLLSALGGLAIGLSVENQLFVDLWRAGVRPADVFEDFVNLRHWTFQGRTWRPLQKGTITLLRAEEPEGDGAIRYWWERHTLDRRIDRDTLLVMWDALSSEMGETIVSLYQLDVVPFRRIGHDG